MMQTLESRKSLSIPYHLEDCPFCGKPPYWIETRIDNTQPWRISFYHPGASSDKDCILSGQGFELSLVDNWNRRTQT
jgi:hypothetical protein